MQQSIKRNILLNPGPATTTDTVKQALVVPDICHREKAFTQLVWQIRQDLLKVVNADDHYTSILFAASGTGALEACLTSIVAPQKKIAIINNGSYGARLLKIAERYQIEAVNFEYPFDQALPLAEIEKQIAADSSIDYVAMIHHETSSGLLNPLSEIGAMCQRLGRRFIVDAMSSYAGVPIDVTTDHIDYLISSSNKCLQGMPGLSFVIANKADLLASAGNARSFYFDLHAQYQSLETNGQLAFTPPVQVMYALRQALDELLTETVAGRIARYRQNYDRLLTGLNKLGFRCLTPSERQSFILAIVQFPDNGVVYNFDELHDYLYEKGYTIYPQKLPITNTFRLSCLGDLHPVDIDNFLQELAVYLATKQKLTA